MGALSGGHMEQTQILMPRRDHKPFRGAVGGRVNARHVIIARQRVLFHVEEAREGGYGAGEGMLNPGHIPLAPGSLREFPPVLGELLDHGLDGFGKESIPIAVLRSEKVRRLLRDQSPERTFALPDPAVAEFGIELEGRSNKGGEGAVGNGDPESFDQAKAHGIDGGPPSPVGDKCPRFGK